MVTNIEADHLDFFGTVEAYSAVFDQFVERIVPGGALVVCTDDPGSAALASRAAAQGVRVLAYGAEPNGVPLSGTLRSWHQHDTGAVAEIELAGELQPRAMRLAVPGRHMALNALAAVLAARDVGAPVESVLDGLAGFEGAPAFRAGGHRRRCARLRRLRPPSHRAAGGACGVANGHRTSRGGHVIAVFQPHLYSRTATFAKEFGAALDGADRAVVLDVYAAREQPLPGVSGATVAEHVSVPVTYIADLSAVARAVAEMAGPGDVVVTMGAGDVTMLGPEIVAELQARAAR